MAQLEDAGAYTNTSDVIFRFYPCLISGLAYYLSIKYSPERTADLKMIYEDELARAVAEDGQRTSTYIKDLINVCLEIPSNFKSGETYNVAGDDVHSIEELAKIVIKNCENTKSKIVIKDSEIMTTKDGDCELKIYRFQS